MLHDAWLSIDGRPDQVEQEGRLTRVMTDRYAELLSRYTRKDKRFWQRIFVSRVDRYFTAEEALDWGLVDQLWEEKS
jgi:ATP-dependent protease ClpP protease subunit